MTKKIKVCRKVENGKILGVEYFTYEGKIWKKENYQDGKFTELEVFTYEKQYTLWERFKADGVSIGKRETWYNENNQIEKKRVRFWDRKVLL